MGELVARVTEARPLMSIACLKRSVDAVQALADDLQSVVTTQKSILRTAITSCLDVDGAEVTAFANWTKSVSASPLESESIPMPTTIIPSDSLLAACQ